MVIAKTNAYAAGCAAISLIVLTWVLPALVADHGLRAGGMIDGTERQHPGTPGAYLAAAGGHGLLVRSIPVREAQEASVVRPRQRGAQPALVAVAQP